MTSTTAVGPDLERRAAVRAGAGARRPGRSPRRSTSLRITTPASCSCARSRGPSSVQLHHAATVSEGVAIVTSCPCRGQAQREARAQVVALDVDHDDARAAAPALPPSMICSGVSMCGERRVGARDRALGHAVEAVQRPVRAGRDDDQVGAARAHVGGVQAHARRELEVRRAGRSRAGASR